MTLAISSARAATKRSVSVRGSSGGAPRDDSPRTMSRRRSPRGVPPGSRVRTMARPARFSRRASAAAWSDLPAPSPPSRVMKRPVRFVLVRAGRGRAGRRPTRLALKRQAAVFPEDADAPVGFAAEAAGGEVVALGELVLEAADVGILGRQLHRPVALHDFQGRVLRLLQGDGEGVEAATRALHGE